MPPAFRFRSFYIATVRLSRDHFLPPDPSAFLAAEPATVGSKPTTPLGRTIQPRARQQRGRKRR